MSSSAGSSCSAHVRHSSMLLKPPSTGSARPRPAAHMHHCTPVMTAWYASVYDTTCAPETLQGRVGSRPRAEARAFVSDGDLMAGPFSTWAAACLGNSATTAAQNQTQIQKTTGGPSRRSFSSGSSGGDISGSFPAASDAPTAAQPAIAADAVKERARTRAARSGGGERVALESATSPSAAKGRDPNTTHAMRLLTGALLALAALGAARPGAAADGSCSASAEPGCLRLNKTVLMAETSWYEFARRVQAGVTVIVPIGSTEQARQSAKFATPWPLTRCPAARAAHAPGRRRLHLHRRGGARGARGGRARRARAAVRVQVGAMHGAFAPSQVLCMQHLIAAHCRAAARSWAPPAWTARR